MPIQSYTRKEIAHCQLESALTLYFDKLDYVSALTLAGAAEEILGKIVKKSGTDNALKTYISIAKDVHEIFDDGEFNETKEINSANFPRNTAKHMQMDGVVLDFKEEADHMIDRAISNWKSINDNLSPIMMKFLKYYHEA